MTTTPVFPSARLAHSAVILFGATLLAACGGNLPEETRSREAPTASLAMPASQAYFGAQFGEACLTSCEFPSVQAF